MDKIFLLLGFIISFSSCTLEKFHEDEEFINIDCPVIAAFDIQNNGCKAPCEIVLDNTSENATSFEWDFGEGNNSSIGSPSQLYQTPGEYDIVLKASNGECEKEVSKRITINWEIFSIESGGVLYDYEGIDVCHTYDGGYIAMGWTDSLTSRVSLLKIDRSGDEVWPMVFIQHPEGLNPHALVETMDHSYVIAGYTNNDADGGYDPFLIKVSEEGNVIWTTVFNEEPFSTVYGMQQVTDGGFIMCGGIESDLYLIKADNAGTLTWRKTIPGAACERGNRIIQTADLGYLIIGESLSDCDVAYDILVTKTNADGDVIWQSTYGEINIENVWGITETEDNGFLLVGSSNSGGAGGFDAILMKLDASGNLQWIKYYGGANDDSGDALTKTADGGYIFVGHTYSNSAAASDLWMVKVDSDGVEEWSKTIGGVESDYGRQIKQTSDGGYILIGSTTLASGSFKSYKYILKTDDQGNIQ